VRLPVRRPDERQPILATPEEHHVSNPSGVASASVNAGQQLGGAIGTALLNTIAASAFAGYLAGHAHGRPASQLVHLAQVHSYITVFWWCAGIFAAGAVICGALLRRGPLTRPGGVGPQSRSGDPPVHDAVDDQWKSGWLRG
jgi:hypothetical protein